MDISDLQVAVLGFGFGRASIARHILGVFLHVVHFFVGNDALQVDRLVHVRREIDRVVLVNLPGAAVGGSQEIFIATAGLGKTSGNLSDFALRLVARVILPERPDRR